MDLKKQEIDAAIGLLKINSMGRKKPSLGVKIKKTFLQQQVLKSVYQITSFPSTETRKELALLLGISQRSVQVWFQNKRQISRKKDNFENEKNNIMNEFNKFSNLDPYFEINNETVCDISSKTLFRIIESCKNENENMREIEKRNKT